MKSYGVDSGGGGGGGKRRVLVRGGGDGGWGAKNREKKICGIEKRCENNSAANKNRREGR